MLKLEGINTQTINKTFFWFNKVEIFHKICNIKYQIQSYGIEDQHVSDVMYLNLMLRNQTIYKTLSGN